MQCFDIRKVRIAFGREDVDIKVEMRNRLVHCLKCFANALGKDPALAVTEYVHANRFLLKTTNPGRPLAAKLKLAWYDFLDKHETILRSIPMRPFMISRCCLSSFCFIFVSRMASVALSGTWPL